MSVSDQEGSRRPAKPGATSERAVHIGQKITGTVELTEDGKVILNDAELVEAIHQAE